jgi:hypothetical protein
VTYFEDGTVYGYLDEFADGSVNVGWLDASVPFPTGDVPDAFVDRITELCRQPVNLMRGWHYCNLCPRTTNSDLPPPTTAGVPEDDYPVGDGEIRVPGTEGVRYAAPDMLVHYVRVHGYRPPHVFVDAVLRR